MRGYIRLSHSLCDESICDNLDSEFLAERTFTVLRDGSSITLTTGAPLPAVAEGCKSVSGFALIGALTR
jgi:hypothetical protein